MSKSLIAKLIATGTDKNFDTDSNDKIKISNSISIIIAFGAALPFIVISHYLYPSIVWIPVSGMAISLLGILFNYFRLYALAKYLLSVFPLAVATLYQASLLNVDEPLITGIYTIQLAFALFPFLMIQLKERALLVTSLFTVFLLIVLFPQINAYYDLALDSSLFRASWLNSLAAVMGLLMSFSIILTLVFLNSKSSSKNKILLSEIEGEKEKANASEQEMQKSLERLQNAQEEEKKRNWISQGMSSLGDIIRKSQGGNQFYGELIRFMVKYLQTNQGAIYTIEGDESYEEISIVPQAAYAFNRNKRLKERYQKGEGLVGQAYLEKDIIYLTEVPENYIKITSGLGDANPRCIIVVPLIQNDKVEGIIELASFKILEAFEVDFLKEAGETIASSIFNFRINAQTKLLLEESQQQTEEMQAQEEEMRQNMEEMQATQDQIDRNRHEQAVEIERLETLHKQNTERYKMLSLVADHTDNSVIITGADGLIEYVNAGFTKLTDFTLEEIRGKKPGSFLQGRDTDKQTTERIRQKLNSQESFYEEILNYDRSGKEYWISMAINPVFDNGVLTNYISVQANITATKQIALDQTSQVQAINRNLATIEFDLDGKILDANENFLNALNYSLEEVRGKHHRIFVKAEHQNTEYEEMWLNLANGQTYEAEVERLSKSGDVIWLMSNYTPILDITGKPYKVIKYAQDITDRKKIALDFDSQIEAISKNTAIIEFDLAGNILSANANFLKSMGYKLQEVKGKHHSIFVFENDLGTGYEQMWEDLRNGISKADDFKRKSKSGDAIWLKSTYTPILNLKGEPYKIVKYAIDITASKEDAINYQSQIEAIWRNYAVIGFDLNGKIQEVNDNFLNTMGYTSAEIIGKAHSMFVFEEDLGSDYVQLWNDLRKGIPQSRDFKRKTKSGKTVWLQSIYTPILDLSGKPYKVVKYAQNITEAKELMMQYSKQLKKD